MIRRLPSDFAIGATWAQGIADGEQDVANVRIEVRDVVITRVAEVLEETNRDYIRTSGVSLALWFADNWWRLRWESPADTPPSTDWRCRHELTSVGGGRLMPPVMIYGTGQRVVFAPSIGRGPQGGPVRFIDADQVMSIPGTTYEQGVDEFFTRVLANCSKSLDGPVLKEIVDVLLTERQDSTTAAWRRLEARLGFDVDQGPAELLVRFMDAEKRFGESAIEEAANASRGPDKFEQLTAVLEVAENSSLEIEPVFSTKVANDLSSSSMQPWQLGEEVAAHLRRDLQIGDAPVSTSMLCDLIQFPERSFRGLRENHSRLAYGARLESSAGRQKVALKSRYLTDRRFEVARVLGDMIWSDREPLGVITKAKTDRQKFQRAFAQSLLVPVERLSEYFSYPPEDEDITRLAWKYEVHANVLKTMLVNKNILPREFLGDRLEAA